MAGQIDGMRLPRDALQVEEDAELLRARRAGEVQHVHALPAQHLAGLDVAVDELDHDASRLFGRIIGSAAGGGGPNSRRRAIPARRNRS